jgi:hypothetical protein
MTLTEIDSLGLGVVSLSELPKEKKETVVAGVKAIQAVTARNPNDIYLGSQYDDILIKTFGADAAQQGLEKLKSIPKADIARIGTTTFGKIAPESLKGLKPSPDLFSTSVYTFHDKSPAQIAFDTRALLQSQKLKKEINSLQKQAAGESVHINIAGKTASEITKMNLDMNAKSARRNEEEREFSSNPVIASLDTVASAVTTTTGFVEKGASSVLGFAKENPMMSIAGVLGGGAVLNMFSDGVDFSDLLLIGAVLFIGSTWLYSSHPDKFNEIAGQFGIDKFFGKAPATPMWTGTVGQAPTAHSADVAIHEKTVNKYGNVSAEAAGGSTTTDSMQLQRIGESINALAQGGSVTEIQTQSRRSVL